MPRRDARTSTNHKPQAVMTEQGEERGAPAPVEVQQLAVGPAQGQRHRGGRSKEKRDEDEAAKDEVRKKLQEGLFTVVRLEGMHSEAWEKFGKVVDVSTNESQPYVVCLNPVCATVKVHKKGSGTLGLKNHTCPNPTPIATGVTDSQKQVFKTDLVYLIVSKLLSPTLIENEEFQNLLQNCINIGAESGKVNIKELVMDHKTLTSAIKKTAKKAEAALIADMGETIDDGLSSATVDGW